MVIRSLTFGLALLLSGCAASRGEGPLDPPAHGELSLIYDAGDENPPDLGVKRVDLAGADLAGVDLAGSGGCGLGSVVVNELQTGGATASDEFIELYNPCATAIDLTGATVVYRAATNSTGQDDSIFAKPTKSIPAGGYFLVAGASYKGGPAADATYTSGGMNAVGGAVGLRAPNGTLIDSVGWGSANNPLVEKATAPNPAAGHSIARIPNGHDANDNSADFQERTTPTPKAANQ